MLTMSRLGFALLLLVTPAAAQVLAARQALCTSFNQALTSGDLDGDGLLDVVTSGFAMNVFLHDPAGGFGEYADYSDGHATGAIALGHLDGDQVLDVVLNVTSSGVSRLLYRLGDGTGGFGPVVMIQLPTFPRGLAVADLDGDGDDDVAITTQYEDGVMLLLGDGAGNLAPPVAVASVGDVPWDVQAGDLDDDGDLDLAATNSGSDTISVLANDGTAAFATATHAVPNEPLYLLIADVNEDAHPDLVVNADVTAILRGNGAGGFAPFQPLPWHLARTRFADVDGNGFGDLVGFGDEGLQVLFGSEGPTFISGPAGAPADDFGELLVLDADLDGLPDVVGEAYLPWLVVLRGQGFGIFESFVTSTCVGPPQAVTTGDFDNDGDVDAALANAGITSSGGVVVMRNEGGGELTQVSNIGMGQMYDIEAGDVDSNGDLDLVSSSTALGLKLQLGDGSGTYGAATAFAWDNDQDAALGDMDGDGDTDVATCWGTGATGRLGYFTSDGTGGFTGPKSKVLGATPTKVKLADLNVDGQLDLVGLAPDVKLALAILVHGGALGAPIATPLVHTPRELDVGNIDADGLPDLVTLGQGAFEVRLGNGAGDFVPHASLSAGGASYDLVITDMSGDDLTDILSCGYPGSAVLVLQDGPGSFGDAQSHVGGSGCNAITAADLTGDGLRDALVVSGGETTTLTVVPNIGPDEPWTWLGSGKMGTIGIPMLVAHGTLQPGAVLTLELRGAAASSAATLVVGLAALFAPFKGGVLVPFPSFLLGGFVTDAEGGVLLDADWPAGVAPGFQAWYQFWIADAAATTGFSASNGVTAVAP